MKRRAEFDVFHTRSESPPPKPPSAAPLESMKKLSKRKSLLPQLADRGYLLMPDVESAARNSVPVDATVFPAVENLRRLRSSHRRSSLIPVVSNLSNSLRPPLFGRVNTSAPSVYPPDELEGPVELNSSALPPKFPSKTKLNAMMLSEESSISTFHPDNLPTSTLSESESSHSRSNTGAAIESQSISQFSVVLDAIRLNTSENLNPNSVYTRSKRVKKTLDSTSSPRPPPPAKTLNSPSFPHPSLPTKTSPFSPHLITAPFSPAKRAMNHRKKT